MPEGKKRVFNYRPMVLAALSLMCGIALSALVNLVDTALFVGIVAATVLAAAAIFIFRKKRRIVGLILVFLVGFFGFVIDYNASVPNTINVTYAELCGRVDSLASPSSDGDRVIIEAATLDGQKLYGKVLTTLDAENDVRLAVGDLVRCYAAVDSLDFNPFDGYSASYDRNDIRYTASVKLFAEIEGEELTFSDKVKARFTLSTDKVLTSDEQGVALSLLFGDKSQLDYSDYSIIKASGLAHIFAVSGLHIGFLVAVLSFILKKLRVNPICTFVVVVATLLLYGVLCDFPASLLRALVMTVLVLGARALKQRPDILTSLATAVFVILLFNPSGLFDIGFLMSVSAVGGIVLFASPIAKKLKNLLKSRMVSSSVAMSVSSTAGIFPIMTNVFNGFSVYFVLANLICLPLVSVLFVLLLMAFLLCLIHPIMAVTLFPAKYLVRVLLIIADFIASLPFATIGVLSMGAVAIVYVTALINVSRFNMLPIRSKTVLTVIATSIAVLLYVIGWGAVAIISA